MGRLMRMAWRNVWRHGRRTMTVVGVYEMGMAELERGSVYVSLAEAQVLFSLPDQVKEIVVSLAEVGQEPTLVATLRAALPGYEVDSWQTLNPDMMQAFVVNEQVMGLFGLVILLIAAVGLLNILMIAVTERTREIGVLAALGLKRSQTLALSLQEGVLMGLLGALAGTLLAGAW